jgi:hypothetical protein
LLVSIVTCEQKHIHRLIQEAKADLYKIDSARKTRKQEVEQLELSKKDRIKKLAQDIDATGIIPTTMICSLIVNKPTDCIPNRHYVVYNKFNLCQEYYYQLTIYPAASEKNVPSSICLHLSITP